MNTAILIPLLLGSIAILQGALNKEIMQDIGLTWMAFLGCLVTMIICFLYLLVAKTFPENVPALIKAESFSFKPWYIIPGIFGFLFVILMPIAIIKVGAIKTSVGLIAAQMVTSVFWDKFVEGYSISMNKVLGVLFALVSVAFITLG